MGYNNYQQDCEEMDDDQYEEFIEEMKIINTKTNKVLALKRMKQTKGRRSQWIITEKPSVIDVIERFPLLKEPCIVSV